MTDIRQVLSRGRNDFVIRRSRNTVLFLCKGGLNRHWNVPKEAKSIEVRLHDKQPSLNAHRFRCEAFSTNPGLSILPDGEETWESVYHGTYYAFGDMLRKFRDKSGSNMGWMEISVLE